MEQPEARQSRLERQHECDHERRAMEQPEPRQSRLERLRERNRQQRAAEQADARQARLTRNREANQRRRQAETQPEPERTSMPALDDEWVHVCAYQIRLHACKLACPLCPAIYYIRSFPSPLTFNVCHTHTSHQTNFTQIFRRDPASLTHINQFPRLIPISINFHLRSLTLQTPISINLSCRPLLDPANLGTHHTFQSKA